MERAYGVDDRIRRAEEIYARRQNLRERTRRARVTIAEPKNYKLLKKLVLQIVICILIYFIFHLISTTNYDFSEETLQKAKDVLSHDLDFSGIWANIQENVNSFLELDKEKKEQNQETQNTENENQENTENNQEANPSGENQDLRIGRNKPRRKPYSGKYYTDT